MQNFDSDLMKLSASIKSDYGEGFKLKFLGDRIRIQLVKVEDFHDLKKKLFGENKAFHTFTMNAQKALVVVLKGLSRVPSETILADIREQGLRPVSCSPLVPEGKRKSPYCTYKVVFPQGTSFNAVAKIGHIFYTRIYWEKFHSLKPYTQCFRCQSFGHSSTNCNHPPRCVKCAGTHLTRECDRAAVEAPSCANCSGAHPANFSKCPALTKFLGVRNKQQAKVPNILRTTDLNNKSTPLFSKASLRSSVIPVQGGSKPSYSDALVTRHVVGIPSGAAASRPEPCPATPLDVDAVMETLNVCKEIGKFCDGSKILKAARQLLSKLKSCTSKTQQLAAFLEVAQSLD